MPVLLQDAFAQSKDRQAAGRKVRPASVGGRRSIEVRIKIRHRSPFPKPWKWEMYVGKRLVTASNESYASQDEAHGAGKDALDRMVLESAHARKLRDR